MELATVFQIVVSDAATGGVDPRLSSFAETLEKAADMISAADVYGRPVAVQRIDYMLGAVADVSPAAAELVRGILAETATDEQDRDAIAFVEARHPDNLCFNGFGGFLRLARSAA